MKLELYEDVKYPNDPELKEKKTFFIVKTELEKYIQSNKNNKEIHIFTENFNSILQNLNVNTSEYNFYDYDKFSNLLYITKMSDRRIGFVVKNVKISEKIFGEYKIYLFALEEEFMSFTIKEWSSEDELLVNYYSFVSATERVCPEGIKSKLSFLREFFFF